MRILLCMISIALCTTTMCMEGTKDLMLSERGTVRSQNSSVSCSNDDTAHMEACAGTGCFLLIPVCGLPAAITSLCCLLDATKRFEQEERSHHQVDLENND